MTPEQLQRANEIANKRDALVITVDKLQSHRREISLHENYFNDDEVAAIRGLMTSILERKIKKLEKEFEEL